MDTARCLLSIDDSVGRVLDTLERRGELENTVVVFTGDNGLMLGEHAFLPGGKQLLYEESVRIPLAIQGPGFAAGQRADAMVSAVDLAPTLWDMAGATPPPVVHGRSLRPLLVKPRRTPRDWRRQLLMQHFLDPRWPARPDLSGLRTDRHKLVVAPAHADGVELYDLEDDPHELVNLASDPTSQPLLAELRAHLASELARVEADRLPRP